MEDWQCVCCGAPSYTGTCDPCHLARIDWLLASPGWLKTRGAGSGDLKGETYADTIRREAEQLREAIRNEVSS